MSMEFITFLPPQGSAIKDYDRSLSQANQPESIHSVFRDAMSVREEVFVKEQNVPLDRELDDEDQYSYQWVVYASVGAPKGEEPVVQRGFGTTTSATSTTDKDDGARSRSGSTATQLPVGIIRLVPPPDAISRGRRGSTPQSPAMGSTSSEPECPHPTVFPGERYIRLGRLATLKEYRGLGLSRLLVNAALQYARGHADEFAPPRVEGVALEEARLEGKVVNETWNGLVYVHAQKDRTMGLWKRYGFQLDEGMGTWDEEGMDHVGMWKRLDIATHRRRSKGPSASAGGSWDL